MSQKFSPRLEARDDDAAPGKATLAAQKGSPELSTAQLEMVTGGVEQVLTIGSASSGAGAGKVTFKTFSITRD